MEGEDETDSEIQRVEVNLKNNRNQQGKMQEVSWKEEKKINGTDEMRKNTIVRFKQNSFLVLRRYTPLEQIFQGPSCISITPRIVKVSQDKTLVMEIPQIGILELS